MVDSDITKLDLYSILEITEEATKKEIVKAYRKKALKCHPDKNPDNPAAAELFHQLSKALEVLTDVAAKAAYDNVRKAKKAAHVRLQQYDSKRKKLKEDLEAREAASEKSKNTDVHAKRNLEAEIQRLRKEGSKLLEQEQELLKEALRSEVKTDDTASSEDKESCSPRIKIKWKSKKDDDSNGGYSYEILEKIFIKYGKVAVLVMSSKKGSAMVEFESSHAAVLATQMEIGHGDNPLKLSWISGEPAAGSEGYQEAGLTELHHQQTSQILSQPPPSDMRDYESLVLMKLRQAEERKKLIEQMQKEDEET